MLKEYGTEDLVEDTDGAGYREHEQTRIDAIDLRRLFPYVEGVTHRFVEAAGVRLHITEAGAGEPVILLHTMPQHWYAWHHIIPQLAGVGECSR